MNVSVYGTLKKGFRANSMMDNMNFIGESVEQLNFEMVDLGSFPALFESEEKHNITIETYELKDNDKSTLQRLDNYEGNVMDLAMLLNQVIGLENDNN